jgi:hypothetical protein
LIIVGTLPITTNTLNIRRSIAISFAAIAWFSVLAQFYLMIENRTASIPETIIRFFSFFTILTNSLVAVYFTIQSLQKNSLRKPGTLTAITVYITIVGLVYQILLRQIWKPTGLQMVVNELLHSVIPLLVILYWYLYEDKIKLRYKQIPVWLIYPFAYLIYVLIRGHYSDFYPYPFISVTEIGITQTLVNASFLIVFFFVVSAVFIFIGRQVTRSKVVDNSFAG